MTGRNERTVVMDKSKGEPVISVKTKSKERVSKHWPYNNLYNPYYTRTALVLPICRPGFILTSGYSSLTFLLIYCFTHFSLLFSRAQRVGTANRPVRRRKISCRLTRSRSRERGRGRDNERGRSERWRDADARKDHAVVGAGAGGLMERNWVWKIFLYIYSFCAIFFSVTGTVIGTTVRSVSESVCSGRERRGNTWCGRDTGWRYCQTICFKWGFSPSLSHLLH